MKLEDEIATRFKCSLCRSAGGSAKRFAATGTGWSRLLDIQHNVFIAVSCKNCGYTDVFNPDMLENKDEIGVFLDAIFG